MQLRAAKRHLVIRLEIETVTLTCRPTLLALPVQVQMFDGPSHDKRACGVSLEGGAWLEWFARVEFTFELVAQHHDRPADERLLSADAGVWLCPCNDVHHPLLQLCRD